MLIVHTSDLSGERDPAFEQAVALCARGGARLVSVHACVGSPSGELPKAAELLGRWGLPDASVQHERLMHECCDDVTDTLLDALAKLQPDLVVASTHARTGLGSLLRASVAEAVARNAAVPTLILPIHARGFVDPQRGALALEHVLLPAGDVSDAQQAVDATALIAKLAGVRDVSVTLLHVADGRPAPNPELPRGLKLSHRTASGDLDRAIVTACAGLKPSMVAMVSGGHDGLADIVFGSHTERALHELGSALLWVPRVKR